MVDLKQRILNTISDAVSDIMYYDRKEDEELPRGAIEQAIKDGVITMEEIVTHFKKKMEE